ncbi:MAG: hypothetical protein FWD71_06870 [Oscillospiraceae bacterium]|nr:hypothetical protein [Oscillospiraceae bacterium]
MIEDYIYLSKYDKQLILSNILHDIKYNKDLDVLRAKYDLSSELNLYISDHLQDLCVLATYIEQAFVNRFENPPEWIYDERLYLSVPYCGLFKTPEVVFFAPQACYRHNVFFRASAFEVL